jgi:GNAT superfamily N-acetyltransferase
VSAAHDIRLANADDEALLRRCFRPFAVLRPHLTEETFVRGVRRQVHEGYRLIYIEADGAVAAAAGYRTAHFLAWGHVLYVDDLVCHPQARRRGYAGALLDWLIAEAGRLGCDELHLDSGYQRNDAHRLYLNRGLQLGSHHFALKLAR